MALTINPSPVDVIFAAAANRPYNGTASATITGATLNGVFNSDDVTLASLAASFANKNVGTAKPVTTAFTLGGTKAGNYTVNQPTGLSANITPAALSVAGAVASNKVYDRSTSATVTGGSLSGVFGGDTVSISGANATFANKNVGLAKAVTTSYTLSGADAGNYALTQPSSLNANITAAALSVTGAVASNKVYNISTSATVTGGTVSGVLGGDTVSLSGANATFADKNVGLAKAVTTSYTLSGADAGNYAVTQPSGLNANITAAALSVTGAVASNKVYDRSTSATVTGGSLTGGIGGDSVVLVPSAASFADKNVGTAKQVVATYSISGADAGNYALAPVVLAANITPAPLTVTGSVADSKVYDGSTAATVAGGALQGVLAGDSVALAPGPASFADKNVGVAKPVTASISISGADAGNYALAQPTGLTADITPALLSVTGGAATSKTYDGNTSTTVSGSTLAGVLGGDTVNLQTGAGVFADANVGADKPVLADFSLTGADAGNYQIGAVPIFVADITRLASVAWVGGASGDWLTATNWAGGAVPTRDNVANVVIPKGAVATLGPSTIDNAPVLSSLTGAGGVQLTQASIIATGAVDLGSVTVGSGANLSALSLSTNQFTQSGGQVAVTGPLLVNGSFTQTGGLVRAGGTAAVRQALGDLSVSHLVSNGLTLDAPQGNLSVANIGSVGDASLTASGAISQAAGGSFTVLGKATVSAGGNVTLDQARNMVLGQVDVQGQNIVLMQGLDDLVLGNVSAAGSLNVSAATANIRQAGSTALTVAGTTLANAPRGSIYLQNSGNSLGGAVSATGSDVGITQGASPLVLGDVSASGNFAVVGAGAVSQTGTLLVSGQTSLDAGTNSVTVDNAANKFTGAVAVRSGALKLVNGAAGLTLGNVITSGDTLVTSLNGPIVQSLGVFSHSGTAPASFNAWQDGVYAPVSLNTSALVTINGQLLSTTASVTGGMSSALSMLTAPVNGSDAAANAKPNRVPRILAIPSVAPVAAD